MNNNDDDDPIALHDRIKLAGSVHREVVKFVLIQLGGWVVWASVASPIDRCDER